MITLTEQQAKALKLYTKDTLSIRDISLTLGVSYSRAINILNEILVKTGYRTRKELLANGLNLEYEVK